ncbi:MAG: Holliday junction DNA helicase RuvB [Planctomycetota bacterium]|jgi:Holliday junction DNA helicase RuvB
MRLAMLPSYMAGEHIFDPGGLEGAQTTSGDAPTDTSADHAGPPESEVEVGLRPACLQDFVGQTRVVDNLQLAISAAKMREEPTEHILFSGPPGLGKTSLSRILAAEMGARLVSTSGPGLERPKDLVGILTQLEQGDVLFIDEVHRTPQAVEEYLYTAMEDFSVDLTIDSGPHARVMTMGLKPFTLVGATTREGLLSAPFRARFGIVERLSPYPTKELVTILSRSATILGAPITDDAAQLIGERSRGTPRIANRLLRRARDMALVRGIERIDQALASETLERLGIDDRGLEEMDRRILRCLANADGAPVGLKTIAAAIDESEDTIADVFEPHLLRCGLLQRTSRGRVLTATGRAYIGEGKSSSPGTAPEEIW